MRKRITIIQGHPDSSQLHLCPALADAYKLGAEQAGFEVRAIPIAELSFPLIRSKEDFEHGERPTCIQEAQSAIRSSEHLVLVYPLWLGTMPALAYRWYFGAHSLKSLERNILKFSGIAPVRESLFGMVDEASTQKRAKWLNSMRALGAAGR